MSAKFCAVRNNKEGKIKRRILVINRRIIVSALPVHMCNF